MKRIWINKAKSFKEAEDFDWKFWRQAGSHARFSAAYEILKDYMKMKGKNASSLRLRRSVQTGVTKRGFNTDKHRFIF